MGIKVEIEVLESGYFITVKNGEEVIDRIASNYGAWNLTKHLKKYLYSKDEPEKKASKKKTAKKSDKKVNKRKL